MHTTGDHDGLSLGDFFRRTVEVGDDESVEIVACHGLSQYRPSHLIHIGLETRPTEVELQISVSIRETMGKVHFIVIVKELDIEAEGVEECSVLLLESVLTILDVSTASVPALPILFSILGAETQDLHAMIIQ